MTSLHGVLLLAIAAGGALGATLRYLTTTGVARVMGMEFPYGTLLVNILGSLLMGIIIGLFAKYNEPSHAMKAFIVTGVLGGYTTFSTFSLDTVTLIERGEWLYAFLYMFLSVLCAVSALFVAMVLMR